MTSRRRRARHASGPPRAPTGRARPVVLPGDSCARRHRPPPRSWSAGQPGSTAAPRCASAPRSSRNRARTTGRHGWRAVAAQVLPVKESLVGPAPCRCGRPPSPGPPGGRCGGGGGRGLATPRSGEPPLGPAAAVGDQPQRHPPRNAPSTSTGTASLTSTAAATSTSSPNPAAASSRPPAQAWSAAAGSSATARQAATASPASGSARSRRDRGARRAAPRHPRRPRPRGAATRPPSAPPRRPPRPGAVAHPGAEPASATARALRRHAPTTPHPGVGAAGARSPNRSATAAPAAAAAVDRSTRQQRGRRQADLDPRRRRRASNRPTASTASRSRGVRRRALVAPGERVHLDAPLDRDGHRGGERQHVHDDRHVGRPARRPPRRHRSGPVSSRTAYAAWPCAARRPAPSGRLSHGAGRRPCRACAARRGRPAPARTPRRRTCDRPAA